MCPLEALAPKATCPLGHVPTRASCALGYVSLLGYPPPSGYVPTSGSAPIKAQCPSRLCASIYMKDQRLDPSLKAIDPNTFNGSTPGRSGTASNGWNHQLQIMRHPRTDPDQEDPGIFTTDRRPPPNDQSPLLLLSHRRHILGIPVWQYAKNRISWFINYQGRRIHSTTCILPPIIP
ncbi:hypothetical protein YC2023_010973 [Brassica napus]